MTETKWTLPTPDGKTIYGVKNSSREGANAAIFMAHGLTSTMYDYAFKRAADYFSQHGYDVYRCNFYDGQEGSRLLVDCTLRTHADDFSTVINAFRSSYEKVFVIGHSYGGPTIMLANPANVTAASLWDPSFDLAKANKDFSGMTKTFHGFLRLDWGTTILLNAKFEEYEDTFDEAECIRLSKAFQAPIQVVFASEGYYVKQPYNYHSFGHPQNRSDTVEGTQHCFHEGTTCDSLLAKTHDWFKQF